MMMRVILLICVVCILQPCFAAGDAKPSTNPQSKTSPASSEKTPKAASASFYERKEVQKFLKEMNRKHNISFKELTRLFKDLHPDPKVIQAISKPFEEMPWTKYKERFVNEERAKAGVQFWKEHRAALEKAQQDYGVPIEVIVAILGVETYYGRIVGTYPVLQTLSTLAFDYPPRAPFFKGELEQFLLLLKEEKLNPDKMVGSYAGAMGVAQFMPSSYRQYAVDFTDSGKKDIIHNVDNAIGSVANYFKSHGWKEGEAVAYPAAAYGMEYQRLANSDLKDLQPKLTLESYSQFNIQPKDKTLLNSQAKTPAAFIILNKNEKDTENWLTLYNFWVITRYNKSMQYAMAVYQLSQRIKELYQKDR